MPEDQRRFAARAVAKKTRDVRTANTREIDRHFHLPAAWYGTRALFHFYSIGCGVDQRSHMARIVHVGHMQDDEILIFRLTKTDLCSIAVEISAAAI